MKHAEGRTWVAPILAAMAFAVCLVVFLAGLFHYRQQVWAWSRAELQSRAEFAARLLEEPLRTLDHGEIARIGARFKTEGLRLRITGSRFSLPEDTDRPGFYDTLGDPKAVREPTCWGVAKSGNFSIGAGRPIGVMMRPFRRALVVVALAGALGMAGVFLFFFVTYRQSVRIRELARLESFRRTFIADFSHELKTPLTGILGAAEMLSGQDVLVAMIRRECTRLNALAEGVLELARLERADETVTRTETDLAQLVRACVAHFEPQAAKQGVTLTSVIDASPLLMACDAFRLSEVLENLIANALRHAQSPDIVVTLADDRRHVRIIVEDHGIGIPAAARQHIFERFYRVDASRTMETGGTGLGLAIAQRIAQLHGGDITLEESSPTGCRFILTLPKDQN